MRALDGAFDHDCQALPFVIQSPNLRHCLPDCGSNLVRRDVGIANDGAANARVEAVNLYSIVLEALPEESGLHFLSIQRNNHQDSWFVGHISSKEIGIGIGFAIDSRNPNHDHDSDTDRD
jgi:hypothetical protein